MKVPDCKGVANHTVPESCVRRRREAHHEALTGVRVGQAIEPRNLNLPGCRRCSAGGRQHGRVRYSECPSGPAWSREPGMHVRSLHGNREIFCLATDAVSGGPHREGEEP